MEFHRAEKVVIITENIIVTNICDIIEQCGATGYTISSAGGKGSRNVRSTLDHASVVEGFSNVKIEVIVNDVTMAKTIMSQVIDKFFNHYSGITFMEYIDVLRPNKFGNTF